MRACKQLTELVQIAQRFCPSIFHVISVLFERWLSVTLTLSPIFYLCQWSSFGCNTSRPNVWKVRLLLLCRYCMYGLCTATCNFSNLQHVLGVQKRRFVKYKLITVLKNRARKHTGYMYTSSIVRTFSCTSSSEQQVHTRTSLWKYMYRDGFLLVYKKLAVFLIQILPTNNCNMTKFGLSNSIIHHCFWYILYTMLYQIVLLNLTNWTTVFIVIRCGEKNLWGPRVIVLGKGLVIWILYVYIEKYFNLLKMLVNWMEK